MHSVTTNMLKKYTHDVLASISVYCVLIMVINIYTMQNTRAYSKFKYHETSRYP